MTLETIFVNTWSARPDGSYFGAGGGGIGIPAKYVADPDESHYFSNPAAHAANILKRDGHVILKSMFSLDNEPPRQRRDWYAGGTERSHNDADFCEVGHTWGSLKNQSRWRDIIDA